MRIVIDCRCIHQHMGGIGRAALNLLEHLDRSHGSHVLTAILGGHLPDDVALESINLIQADAGMIDEHFEQFGLPSTLQSLDADVYVNMTFSIPALKTTRFQVAVIHDVVFEDHPEWVEPSLRGYLQRWSRFSAAHADRIVTVSDHARARIEAVYRVSSSRLIRIYNGIGAKDFETPTDTDVSSTLSKFGLNRPFILYLGTLELKKGIPELLDAFAALVRSGHQGDLVLCGGSGGPQFDVSAAIKHTGLTENVKCPGYVSEDEKKALLSGCELFVYPSKYEGFGLPPLEAMALGKPCVVSNATSIPEIVGSAAITVDILDQLGFLRALQQGLTDEVFRNRVKIAGPLRAREFSWDRSAKELLSLCEALGQGK